MRQLTDRTESGIRTTNPRARIIKRLTDDRNEPDELPFTHFPGKPDGLVIFHYLQLHFDGTLRTFCIVPAFPILVPYPGGVPSARVEACCRMTLKEPVWRGPVTLSFLAVSCPDIDLKE